MLRTALILFMAMGLSACPGGKPSKSKSGATVIRVKGDPNVFIKDSALNGLRALPSKISGIREWEFDISGFQEEKAETDVKKAVQEQTPQENSGPQSYKLAAQKMNDQWILEGTFKKRATLFIFTSTPNGWAPYSFRLGSEGGVFGESSPFEIIHTSVLPDLSAFTLLVQNRKPGERKLYSFTFVRSKTLVNRIGDRLYEYIFGKGVKVGWNKQRPRVLQVCGQWPEPFSKIVQEEAAVWSQALGERLPFSAVKKTSCPPFSDLNTQTYTFTTDWIEIQGQAGVPAQTLNIAGPGREEFIDSDIFFLMGEYQEAGVVIQQLIASPAFQKDLRRISLHEIGHLLGLHHQFNPAIQSIMSYDEKTEAKLYDYDVKAIQHLYEN